MSETRAKITAEELHKTCKPRNARCDRFENMPECEYKKMCGGRWPAFWDLTNPPRFNEAQMALLKVFYDRGFRKVITGSTRDALVDCIREFLGIGEGVTIDLAELLGKDGADGT